MPAITVEDTATLHRLPKLPEHARQRPVRRVTDAPKGFEGEGFPVRRAFAGVDLAELDPFIHLDQIGEVNYCPGDPKGPVAPSPRVRDRHVHDGRRHPARRFDRWRRRDP